MPLRRYFQAAFGAVASATPELVAGRPHFTAPWRRDFSALGVELPGKFSEFGAMLVQGLINGIAGMGGAVKDAIGNLGGEHGGLVQGKLGIRSPSRVFYGHGNVRRRRRAARRHTERPAGRRKGRTGACRVGGYRGAPRTRFSPPWPLRRPGRPRRRKRCAGAASIPGRHWSPAPRGSVLVQGDTVQIQITASAGMSPEDIAGPSTTRCAAATGTRPRECDPPTATSNRSTAMR